MTDRFPDVAREIACVDCGGTAHLITSLPTDDDLYPGDVLAYRCSDCNDRWDIVYEPGGDEG
ncbi:MAG: hypothetical protein OEM97_10920 [Acidimicrobiia bacterium]|nr:hypothetical protein [Acidimicrobiia bacterium]